MKVESGAASILRALCWSSVTSGIPRKALERTRSVANTVPSYLNSFISGSVVGSLYLFVAVISYTTSLQILNIRQIRVKGSFISSL